MAMPEYTPAPAPSKAEFDSLASDVSTLNGKVVVQNEGSGKNLNNYTTQGWYRFSGSLTNSPSGNYGLLYVETYTSSNETMGRQIWFPEGSDDVFIRRLYNGFESWIPVTTRIFGNGHNIYTVTTNDNKTIDEIVDSTGNAGTDRTFGIDIVGTIKNLTGSNRSFALGWVNASGKFGWIIVFSFGGLWFGKRQDSTTFTMSTLG